MTVFHDADRRHDFVLLFDVTDGNPNGDPDAGNLPRVDPETMQGLVTDVCLKRKVRNYVDVVRGAAERFKIFVQHHGYLYDQQRGFYDTEEVDSKDTKRVSEARAWMCNNFYDVRVFGAVMSTSEYNCGQVRGPVQLTFARSIDVVVPLDISITRVALTRYGDRPEGAENDERSAPTHGTMGRKALLPYGLYRCHGFFSPHLARQTKADSVDLALFLEALQNMWDLDHSASRGMMACRGLYVFSHENGLGRAPAHALFDLVRVPALGTEKVPRSFADYRVEIDEAGVPEGVVLTRMVG